MGPRPLTFASLSALAAAIIIAAPAWADSADAPAGGQVVAAAPAGASAPPSPNSPAASPDKVIQDWDNEDDDDQGPAPNDKKIHGEMGVGVGSNGYREIYGSATAPLPDGGEASVAVDYGQIGPFHR